VLGRSEPGELKGEQTNNVEGWILGQRTRRLLGAARLTEVRWLRRF